MRKPSAREFQWEKPMCFIMHDDCIDWFEPVENYKGCGNCSKCKLAIEHKNRDTQIVQKTKEDKK